MLADDIENKLTDYVGFEPIEHFGDSQGDLDLYFLARNRQQIIRVDKEHRAMTAEFYASALGEEESRIDELICMLEGYHLFPPGQLQELRRKIPEEMADHYMHTVLEEFGCTLLSERMYNLMKLPRSQL